MVMVQSPHPEWWAQVLQSSRQLKASQALVYKFNRKPIKVRILASVINNNITDQSVTLDLQWDDFIVILKTLFQKDIDIHESSVQV